MQSERLFFGMLVTSLAIHVALFVIPEWFGDATDAASLPVSRGRVTIRLNRQTIPEPKPPQPLDTPIERVERIVPPLPPRPATDLPSPAIIAARPELERLERSDEALLEPAKQIERAPVAKPDPNHFDEIDLQVVGQEGVDEPVGVLHNPLPPYPRSALRRTGVTLVVLEVRVSANGTAEFVRVVTTCSDPLVDESTRAFVARYWRFIPAKRRGVAVPAVRDLRITFK